MKTIHGKKALVTGAASGIGRAIALALTEQGAQLFLVDVNADGLADVVSQINREGGDAIGHQCDLSNRDENSSMVRAVLETWNCLDILINNAGVMYYGPTHDMTQAQWDWVVDVNLRAPIQITHELLPTLLEQPEAHILNVCSIAGIVAGGRAAAYHTTKFGLVGFTESLRAEYGRRGIGVTALCPGPVQTNVYSSAATPDPVNKPVPTPSPALCASARTVAKRAVRAIRKNRRMVLVTPLAHVLYETKRFSPWLLDALNHASRRRFRRATVHAQPAGIHTDSRAA